MFLIAFFALLSFSFARFIVSNDTSIKFFAIEENECYQGEDGIFRLVLSEDFKTVYVLKGRRCDELTMQTTYTYGFAVTDKIPPYFVKQQMLFTSRSCKSNPEARDDAWYYPYGCLNFRTFSLNISETENGFQQARFQNNNCVGDPVKVDKYDYFTCYMRNLTSSEQYIPTDL
ncbi:hypothetical protein EIN_088910 [Entamoeba invadens IP1]|uniref:Uncharacterized protein n=1 Tax=Entamoeba invadens IP1 TaxID=370355 RepID=A0A0A1TXU1_ENTIV|nr:hypothetical protein EIN_088910 [Entamoeba invadens IP1]ELP84378.1 hypothetical protein EIN_088910 [Entamoeba invadens IP1]|eukprot:XP_004183724.1 hypothetical protein EIN_088910 [Entamoeba invadens IP1]